MPLLGAVEGGGTKFVCAVSHGHDEVVDETRIPTTSPEETLAAVVAFFRDHPIAALGVGMFGPLDLARGATLSTPKAGWDGVAVRESLVRELGVPVRVDTDVNAAALGEHLFGAGIGKDPCLYVTVGTGVGGGVVVDGEPLHGLMHPELGHLAVPVLATADGAPDQFPGSCRFHGRCLEGLVSGPALAARVGHPAEELPAGDPAFELAARYIGTALASAVLMLSPGIIVLGGGVGGRSEMLEVARMSLRDALGGYVQRPELGAGIDEYLVPPGLGAHSGITGAFALAQRVLG